MKLKKTLQHYFNKRLDAVIIELKKEDDEYRMEDYHRIRVEIKKLHTFFDMLDACLKKFPNKKYFAPFKSIFDQVGDIREIQLELALLSEQKSLRGLTKYKKQLQEQLKIETAKFLEIRDKKKKKIKNYGSKAFTYIDQLSKKKVTKYINEQEKKIDDLLTVPGIDAATIHDLRKQLKNYMYLMKSADNDPDSIEQEKIDDFQDLLGKWHDNKVMADHLREFSDDELSKTEKLALQRLSGKLVTAAKKQHAEINQYVVNLK